MKLIACIVIGLSLLVAIVPAVADPEKPLTQQLSELKKQRLKTAYRVNSNYQSAFEAGTITIDQLMDARRKVKDAELAVATSAEAELEALTAYVRHLKGLHSHLYPPDKAKRSGERHDYPELQLEIETAEIGLLEFRLRSKP
jgi:hypothetical protein